MPVDRTVVAEAVVPLASQRAWSLWTTDSDVQAFFPGAARGGTRIELRPGGPYEFYFFPDNALGNRGCDDCVILGFQEGKMLSFTWTNLPDMKVRPHRTHVQLEFHAIGPQKTVVLLRHDGWGRGADWDVAFDYFKTAWPRVMAAYQSHAESLVGVDK